MNTPLITVIIPNYNYSHLIKETLLSVQNQSYRFFECIVVDDGSIDNSVFVIEEFIKQDSRFKIIKKTNGGLSSTRNEGIKSAKGEYVAFLDSDDLWLVDKLKNQLLVFEQTNCDIAFSNIKNFRNDVELGTHVFKGGQLNVYDFLAGNPVPGGSSNFMAKKKVLEDIGFYNNDLRSAEDLHYFFRMALKGFVFAHSNTIDVMIRKHDGSMQTNFLKMYLNKLYCFDLCLQLLVDSGFKADKLKTEIALKQKFQNMLWTARDSKRKDLIQYTYDRFGELLGFKFYFTGLYIKNRKFDIIQKLKS